MNRTLILTAFLVTQMPDLEQELRLARGGSEVAMITLIARYADGTPVRGEIQCAGWWRKFQDGEPEVYAQSLPFKTDSRGAIVMNPSLADEWIVCWSERDGLSGRVTVSFDKANPSAVAYIVMGKDS